MSATETCPLELMLPNETTFVYPGGKTTCLEGGEFAFWVDRGDSDKVLLSFQGGGACLTKNTTVPDVLCFPDLMFTSFDGIYNREDPSNPYKTWTIVEVMYCSGDLHIGNLTRDIQDYNYTKEVLDEESGFKINRTFPFVQHGYHNAKAAVDWLVENFPVLDSLVITGYSAGGAGSTLWANYLLNTYSDKVLGHKALVPDSAAFLFPQTIFTDFLVELCDLPLWGDKFRANCSKGQVSISEAVQEIMELHPAVPFASIQPSTDSIQLKFYNKLANETPDPKWSPEDYYHALNLRLREWNRHPNFVSYVVNTSYHTFTSWPWLFETDLSGIEGARNPFQALPKCVEDDPVACPGSGAMCSGDECCPGSPGLVGGKAFPCPSARGDYNDCEHRLKVQDCTEVPPSLIEWIARFPLADCNAIAGHCGGGGLKSEVEYEGSDYCALELAGKVFETGGCDGEA